jgi:hypothetical protein
LIGAALLLIGISPVGAHAQQPAISVSGITCTYWITPQFVTVDVHVDARLLMALERIPNHSSAYLKFNLKDPTGRFITSEDIRVPEGVEQGDQFDASGFAIVRPAPQDMETVAHSANYYTAHVLSIHHFPTVELGPIEGVTTAPCSLTQNPSYDQSRRRWPH